MTAAMVRMTRWVRWYVHEFSGDGSYDRYVARYRVEHSGSPVPSRRDYERERARHRDRHPASRCC
jgi:uncharacterized short protein YbdD (DUF466 family)